MKYLLDSNLVIDYLRDYQPSISKLKSLVSSGDYLFLSVVTNLELHLGQSITKSATVRKIQKLFFDLGIANLNVTYEIAGLAGDFSRELKIDIPDALIAATAKLNNCILLTKNIKHFRKIKALKIQPL